MPTKGTTTTKKRKEEDRSWVEGSKRKVDLVDRSRVCRISSKKLGVEVEAEKGRTSKTKNQTTES